MIYLSTIQAANASCQVIYGGGQTCNTLTLILTPTPKTAAPASNAALPTQAPVVNKTKGGFPILPSSPVKITPATGPEMLPLIGLIPMGLAGLFLRKKPRI